MYTLNESLEHLESVKVIGMRMIFRDFFLTAFPPPIPPKKHGQYLTSFTRYFSDFWLELSLDKDKNKDDVQ